MESEAASEIEIDLVLEALRRRSGYDLRGYARASLGRRLSDAARARGLGSVAELIPSVLHEEGVATTLIGDLCVSVTELFREPTLFRVLGEEVFPYLATHPCPRIWHAGCSTGEEVYSLAILLAEAGLLERTRIYATDLNPRAIAVAQRGIYALPAFAEATSRYQSAGGRGDFTEHFVPDDSKVWGIVRRGLRERITWSSHDLVRSPSFGEFQLILCRNVMIYFARELRDAAVAQLESSLAPRGYLALGTRESLVGTAREDRFETTRCRALFRYRERRFAMEAAS